MRWIWN